MHFLYTLTLVVVFSFVTVFAAEYAYGKIKKRLDK